MALEQQIYEAKFSAARQLGIEMEELSADTIEEGSYSRSFILLIKSTKCRLREKKNTWRVEKTDIYNNVDLRDAITGRHWKECEELRKRVKELEAELAALRLATKI